MLRIYLYPWSYALEESRPLQGHDVTVRSALNKEHTNMVGPYIEFRVYPVEVTVKNGSKFTKALNIKGLNSSALIISCFSLYKLNETGRDFEKGIRRRPR